MTLDIAVSIVIFLVCMVLTVSVILIVKAQLLHQRCLDILICAYDWLEQIRREQQEVTGHEGTE